MYHFQTRSIKMSNTVEGDTVRMMVKAHGRISNSSKECHIGLRTNREDHVRYSPHNQVFSSGQGFVGQDTSNLTSVERQIRRVNEATSLLCYDSTSLYQLRAYSILFSQIKTLTHTSQGLNEIIMIVSNL